MGCKSSSDLKPQLRQVPFPRGPQPSPYVAHSAADTGYADPHSQSSSFAPVVRTPRSTRSNDGRQHPIDTSRLSPHCSDDELVLVCVDCGAEIEHSPPGEQCPATGKRHC